MPILTFPFGTDGPTVDVLIGVNPARANAYQMAKAPIPAPVSARMLIDTGSNATMVEAGLLAQLRLPTSGQVPVYTPSTGTTPVRRPRFDVSLTLLHPLLPFTIDTFSIVRCPPFGGTIQGLLGRDVLAHCLLVYNGPAVTFSLSF
jgi:hypothetical protein